MTGGKEGRKEREGGRLVLSRENIGNRPEESTAHPGNRGESDVVGKQGYGGGMLKKR